MTHNALLVLLVAHAFAACGTSAEEPNGAAGSGGAASGGMVASSGGEPSAAGSGGAATREDPCSCGVCEAPLQEFLAAQCERVQTYVRRGTGCEGHTVYVVMRPDTGYALSASPEDEVLGVEMRWCQAGSPVVDDCVTSECTLCAAPGALDHVDAPPPCE